METRPEMRVKRTRAVRWLSGEDSRSSLVWRLVSSTLSKFNGICHGRGPRRVLWTIESVSEEPQSFASL